MERREHEERLVLVAVEERVRLRTGDSAALLSAWASAALWGWVPLLDTPSMNSGSVMVHLLIAPGCA